MAEIRGIAAAPGIIIGEVYLYQDDMPAVPQYKIAVEQLEAEITRLEEAVQSAVRDIEQIKNRSENEAASQELNFLDSHLLMLRDPTFFDTVNERIRDDLDNIEWVLVQTVREMTDKLSASSDPYLRERTADIHDVSKRVLGHLMETSRQSLSTLDREVILVAHDLMPSDAMAMNKRLVRGIALDAGGKTSHTAIIARSFEIPAVVGLSDISKQVKSGDTIIVDGNAGIVIPNPDEETRSSYLKALSEWQQHELKLMRLNDLPAETTDGKLIFLKGNIEVPEEVDAVTSHGADGIGLFRSEFLFLQPGALPTEEEQYHAYRDVLQALDPKPVTIRTLDVGGDKMSDLLYDIREKNPILGWRAVRFCLEERHVFETQLRALLRASVHGNLQIMFPMISGIDELNRVFAVLEEVMEQLTRESVPFAEDIPIGIMVEVPSAALTSDALARKADFFSIGTNDLIQYTLAVDRGNERVAYLYEPFHPGLLRLLRIIIDNAHDEGIPVAMCGEMAGDPIATLVLLGLGLDEFSMGAAGIPEVKRIVRAVSMAEAEELTGEVMEMRNADEIDAFVRKHMQKISDLVV